MPDRKHNPRKLIFTLDAVHLLVGIAVVVLAVIAFLSPEEHAVFFPAIFFLAAFLSLMNGIVRLRMSGRDTGKKTEGGTGAAQRRLPDGRCSSQRHRHAVTYRAAE
jgi:hypothetical protein